MFFPHALVLTRAASEQQPIGSRVPRKVVAKKCESFSREGRRARVDAAACDTRWFVSLSSGRDDGNDINSKKVGGQAKRREDKADKTIACRFWRPRKKPPQGPHKDTDGSRSTLRVPSCKQKSPTRCAPPPKHKQVTSAAE